MKGPALRAQQEAAQIFGAERTYFVLNGTSASNKIALQALVAEGDLVLFDRNNHKAANHGALLLGGGLPIFVETLRNPHGLIGPLREEALDEGRLRRSSAAILWSRTRTLGAGYGRFASPSSSNAPMTAPSIPPKRYCTRSATFATTCSSTRPGPAS